jgi:hypothetical protein
MATRVEMVWVARVMLEREPCFFSYLGRNIESGWRKRKRKTRSWGTLGNGEMEETEEMEQAGQMRPTRTTDLTLQ